MRLSICYTLMQLPGTVLVVLFLYFAMDAAWLSELGAALILCAWLLKDIVLYPLFRQAMRKGPPIGAQALVGCRALASTDISESGWVRIQGERWRARSDDGEYLPRGCTVRVVAADGLTLQVERWPDELIEETLSDRYTEHSDPGSQPAA